MHVLMKHNGTPHKCHLVTDALAPLCGFAYNLHTWGVFDVPDAMLEGLPICGACWHLEHPRASDLRARCAAHGWELRTSGVGYELIGNGAPAAFTSEASLVVWLERQKRGERDDDAAVL